MKNTSPIMNVATVSPRRSLVQEVIAGVKERSREINKLEKEGLIKKIAPRIYTSNMEELPAKIKEAI